MRKICPWALKVSGLKGEKPKRIPIGSNPVGASLVGAKLSLLKLPVVAQWVDHPTGVMEVVGSNPS